MRKILCMFIVLFTIGGAVAFSQEGDQYPWYYKLEVAAGFQMGFTMTEDADWIMRPTIVAGVRHYLRPVFRSLVLGYSVFGTISYPNGMEWKSPNGQFIRLTKDNFDSFLGFGGLLGVSLQSRVFGPVGIVLDTGITGNFEGGRGDYSWSPQYQRYDILYNTIDLGLGLNAGMFVDFGRFSLEGGANLGYSFFRNDFFRLYDSASSKDSFDSDGTSSVANIIKAAPYIMIGFKF